MSIPALMNHDLDVSSCRTSSSTRFTPLQFEARVLIDEVKPLWSADITKKLGELVKLEPGWDGYRAMPVSFVNAVFAFRVLERICGPATPAPMIVPGVGGDLQLEWHTAKGDIELHVLAPNNVRAWYTRVDDENSGGEERELKTDFSIVAKWVQNVTEQHAGAL